MWTQEQISDLTNEKFIEKHFGLFQIKEHYKRQNLDPPAESLADLQLFNEEIMDLSKSFSIASQLNSWLTLLLQWHYFCRPPLTTRPFLKDKIIKSYVYFSVIFWYPDLQVSFTILLFELLIENSIPQIFTVYQDIAIFLLAEFLTGFMAELLTGLLLTAFWQTALKVNRSFSDILPTVLD